MKIDTTKKKARYYNSLICSQHETIVCQGQKTSKVYLVLVLARVLCILRVLCKVTDQLFENGSMMKLLINLQIIIIKQNKQNGITRTIPFNN